MNKLLVAILLSAWLLAAPHVAAASAASIGMEVPAATATETTSMAAVVSFQPVCGATYEAWRGTKPVLNTVHIESTSTFVAPLFCDMCVDRVAQFDAQDLVNCGLKLQV